MIDLSSVELLLGHTSEETALVVDDYPYGRRVRTQIRYWLETVRNRGDRLCSQTLNPSTGRWNKPKKSTYSSVGVMYREPDTGYVRWMGLGDWPSDEAVADFMAAVTPDKLNDEQKRALAMLIGRKKAFANVTWTIRDSSSMTEEERKAEDARQKEIEQKIWRLAAHHSAKAHKEITDA